MGFWMKVRLNEVGLVKMVLLVMNFCMVLKFCCLYVVIYVCVILILLVGWLVVRFVFVSIVVVSVSRFNIEFVI